MKPPPNSKVPDGLSVWLDVMRWVSAWLVVAGHVRPLLVQDPSAAGDLGVFWKGFYFVTGFGHQAVIVFFVLSGYLIGGSVLDEVRGGRFRWWSYVARRVTRLYPVLVVGLLAGGALDLLGCYGWNGSGVYTGELLPQPTGLDYDAAARLNGPTLLGNLLFLQTIHVPTFGTNGPLWSLCNEFWYYLLFPALVLTMRLDSRATTRLTAFTLLVVLVCWLPRPVLLYFAVWLFGVGVRYLPRPRVPALLAGMVFVAALCWARATPADLKVRRLALDLLLGLTTAALIWSLTACAAPPGRALHRRFAGFSYSLYVTHFPLVVLLLAVWHALSGAGLNQPPSATTLVTFFVVLTLALGWGYGLSRVTEAHTDHVRRLIFDPSVVSCPLPVVRV